MPATGLKIVGTGACLPWCSISSSFQNSLNMSGHRVYAFLEFCCWNLVPFLPDIGFQVLKSVWSSLTYFSFNDASNALWWIWTASGQFSTETLILRSHAVVIAAVCVLHCPIEIHKAFPEIDVTWRGAYVALQPLYTFQHSECLPKHASCQYHLHLCTPIPSEMLAFELNADDTPSVISNKNVKFGLVWP